MKYIYKTLSLALSLSVFSSCSDFLDQTAPSDMDSETLYNNAYYTSLALNKVYGSLTQDQTYSQWLPIIAGLNTDCSCCSQEKRSAAAAMVAAVKQRFFIQYKYFS